ncbi:MAG: TerC/Alx family metal homeostasis membrane protein [Candidatus Pseudobacter hemicellulosilyticus]|uniref:TerC/Alx family metal homeostasis membrane protein n=1 Tax=Candidatus Pseudobacter hemicellulosilyticus TaxID=3121375 RepID=A0AAJ5WQM9_9BACT|nr:MAG: TerC/Alx family metal homeostasis membrane protein [Pseudobacter sp.]
MMTPDQITYLVFGIVLVLAIVIDLGLFSKKSTHVSLKQALWVSIFWVALGLGFGVFVWFELGKVQALEYVSAYLMEKSLSIDNIFVFILIFNFFRVKDVYYARVLLIGILMAIIFRVLFITVGMELVNKAHWVLYIFGAFLLYTGIKMFAHKSEDNFDPGSNKVYLLLRRFLPITLDDMGGRYIVKTANGKRLYTSLFVVVIMLATTDIVFAVDSIPAVMVISKDILVVYTSNIFAILGLRSLFFLLKGAADKFSHLQQGIAFVLIFIGIKMLIEYFGIHVPVYISLLVIVTSITASIVYSLNVANRTKAKAPVQEHGHATERDLH